MTVSQQNAKRCGMIPEDNPSEFVAKHLSAYAFIRPRVSGLKLLEIGFGDGYGMDYLASSAAQITGVDIAEDNIPLAEEKYPSKNLRFVHFDGRRFPFTDAAFDAACSFQVIEHVPESALVDWLSEIARVLTQNGHFYVSTLNLAHAMKPGRPYEKNIDHEKEFTAPELEALLKKVFPRVEMFGLQYAWKHRVFKRLKKWKLDRSLPDKVNFVRQHMRQVTTDDFKVSPSNVHKAIDLIFICKKNHGQTDR